MRQISYAMQFRGQAGPGPSPNTMKATTTAPSCTITTTVGSGGLSGALQPAAGGGATFESVVTLTGDTSFLESGTIRFGEGHSIAFSTVGQGYIAASADPKLRHGTITWKVDRGQGQFTGATGLITSNFTVSESGEVVDNHFGLIFLS